MKKVPNLFARNENGDLDTTKINPQCEWVIAGEGRATRKLDGTCCLVRDGKLHKRYEVKRGKKPPSDFEPANEVDEETGKQQGWRPVGDGPEDQYHREAFGAGCLSDGTYELCGPKIQGNPEGLDCHILIPHGTIVLYDCPRDTKSLKAWLAQRDTEGIVWHHDDGRMCKVRHKDFGMKRPSQSSIKAP